MRSRIINRWQRRYRGYILLPVVMLISLVAVAAFMLNNETVLQTSVTTSSTDVTRAGYVASAGLQHALWQVEQAGCGPFADINAQAFGNHSYSATITPNNAGGSITTYTVPVSDDAWIRKDLPTNNYGSDAQLGAYYKWFTSDDRHALYRFDLTASGIPSSSVVVSAVAKIFVVTPDPASSVRIHRVTSDWTEGTVNWENVTSDSGSIASIASNPPAGQYVDVNITSLVQGWISGGIANQGILLKPSLFSNDNLSEYTSKEYGNTSQRPVLIIKVADGSLSNRADIRAIGTLLDGTTHIQERKNVVLYQASPGSLSLQPGAEGKDNWVTAGQPTDNFGVTGEMVITGGASPKHFMTEFDVATIPFASRIVSAKLEMYLAYANNQNPAGEFSVHRMNQGWSEGSGDYWNPGDGANWDTSDGSSVWSWSSNHEATAPVATASINPAYVGWQSWDIGSLVQQWVSGVSPNFGLLIKGNDFVSGAGFYSSDNNTASLRPKLTITYACECGITCQAPQGTGQILLVVGDAVTLNSDDSKKKALFEGWGYTVSLIDDDDNQTTFDSAVASKDVAYISSTVSHWTLADKLNAATIGVINEEGGVTDNLGTSSSYSNSVGTNLTIVDNTHYITGLFSSGSIPIYQKNMDGLNATGTLAVGLLNLADWGGVSGLALVDAGALLADGSSTAAGRRLMLPVGRDTKFNWGYLNNNGRLIVQRAIQWGIDGGSAIPLPKKIYWTDDNGERIQRSDEDGSNVETVISGQIKVRGIDIDTVNGKIYWTSDVEIRRADLDGGNIETIYMGSIINLDIKLDVAAGKIYWSHDNSNDQVMRADLDGSNSETINNSLSDPAYMTLDTSAAKLYITEFATGNVSHMNLDGSSATTLITGPDGAVGNALDPAAGKVYWSGGASNDWIKRADLDGSNEETIVTGLNAPQDIVYDVDNDRIYWVDALVVPSIKRANADGSNVETIVAAGLNRPRGIVIVNANLVPPTGSVTGPLAHWKLDESSGNTAVDLEGGHDGTLINSPVWTLGQDNGALGFDGSNDYVDLTSDVELNDVFLGGATVMAWIYAEGWGESDHGRILDKSSQTAGDRDGWMIAVNGDNPSVEIVQGFSGGRGYWRGQAGSFSLNEWVHVAFVYDASSDANDPVIYINGIALSSMVEVPPSGTIRSDASISLRMGNHAQSTSRTFDGKIDDVRIYDRMLGAGEVLAIAGAGGSGGGGSGSGSCDGTFRDEFNVRQYNQNDGTLNWATDWEETGESFNPTGGDIRIDNDEDNYELKIRDDGQTIMREVDLSQAGEATLSFDYWRKNLNGASDYVAIEVSYNGGSSWVELDRFNGDADDSAYSSTSYILNAGSLSGNTRIRFLTPNSGMSNSNLVLFDNVQIQCSP